MSQLPEIIGPFKLWKPESGSGQTGWVISWNDQWLPAIYADRDACLVLVGTFLMGAFLGDGEMESMIVELQDRYNRARPPVFITVDHIIARMAAGTSRGCVG